MIWCPRHPPVLRTGQQQYVKAVNTLRKVQFCQKYKLSSKMARKAAAVGNACFTTDSFLDHCISVPGPSVLCILATSRWGGCCSCLHQGSLLCCIIVSSLFCPTGGKWRLIWDNSSSNIKALGQRRNRSKEAAF